MKKLLVKCWWNLHLHYRRHQQHVAKQSKQRKKASDAISPSLWQKRGRLIGSDFDHVIWSLGSYSIGFGKEYTSTHTYTHAHTHIHTRTQTHTHTHAHTHTKIPNTPFTYLLSSKDVKVVFLLQKQNKEDVICIWVWMEYF